MEKYWAQCRSVIPAVVLQGLGLTWLRLEVEISCPIGAVQSGWQFTLSWSSQECGLWSRQTVPWLEPVNSEPSCPVFLRVMCMVQACHGRELWEETVGEQLQLQDPAGRGAEGGQQLWPGLSTPHGHSLCGSCPGSGSEGTQGKPVLWTVCSRGFSCAM